MTIRVEAKGANARLSHSAADILTNALAKETIDGHSIQLYFTALLARECQATLKVSASPESVTLTAIPAPLLKDIEAAAQPQTAVPSRRKRRPESRIPFAPTIIVLLRRRLFR